MSDELVTRLRVIAQAIADGNRAELTMRIPAEPDRDADLVVSRAADEIERLRAERDALLRDTATYCAMHVAERDGNGPCPLCERDALRALLDRADGIMKNATICSGCCCCGDDMDGHPSPMSCGHSPVDMAQYAADALLKDIDAALRGG